MKTVQYFLKFGSAVFLPLLLISSLPAIDTLGQQPHPAQCSREEFDRLAFLAGEWQVKSRFRNIRREWEENEAESSIAYDLGRCALIERFSEPRQDGPFSALGLFAFDFMSGRLQKVWIDSGHGLVNVYEGSAEASETLSLLMTREIRGQETVFRHVYSEISAERFVLASQRSRDGGRTWDTGWRLEYLRRR